MRHYIKHYSYVVLRGVIVAGLVSLTLGYYASFWVVLGITCGVNVILETIMIWRHDRRAGEAE